jgi:hypothetical protein
LATFAEAGRGRVNLGKSRRFSDGGPSGFLFLLGGQDGFNQFGFGHDLQGWIEVAVFVGDLGLLKFGWF